MLNMAKQMNDLSIKPYLLVIMNSRIFLQARVYFDTAY